MTHLFAASLLFAVATAFAQAPEKLTAALTAAFQDHPFQDGWVFYPDAADISGIDQPAVASALPNVAFYKVTMTNHLGYHVNRGTGVVLFDTVTEQVEFCEPIWYGGVSKVLPEHALRHKFPNRKDLLAFLDGAHRLMEVGSSYRFVLTDSTDTQITYDLVYSTGDSYTTGGGGAVSTVRHGEDGVWRKIFVTVKGNKIVRYQAISPAMQGEEGCKRPKGKIVVE